jgi:hypothetical protein
MVTSKVVVWNIANTPRDDKMSPLADRVELCIRVIKQINPDVVVLLEAGRGSKSLISGIIYTWDSMADTIEHETGLAYGGVWKSGSQHMASGKAVFVRHDMLVKIENLFVGSNSVLKLGFNGYTLGVVHFPMALTKRLFYAQWLVDHSDLFDGIAGDMNTFPESGGPETLAMLNRVGFVERLPEDTRITFRGFGHDVITLTNDELKYHPYSMVVSVTDMHAEVIPATWLDHVLSKSPVRASVFDSEGASDHDALVIQY